MSALNFKRRLRVLVQASGSQLEFSRKLAKHGRRVSNSSISRWLDDNSPAVPDIDDLIAIVQIEPRVSVDYLIGHRPAESVTEKFIEERIG